MYCTLIITRYPKYFGLFGFMSMALFRLPLWFNKKITFWKLMGSGKNGTFDIHPDLNQWALLLVSKDEKILLPFINSYWRFFGCEIKNVIMQPLEGHGKWDGKEIFGKIQSNKNYNGPIAVLTRATIRLKRIKNFWANVNVAATNLQSSKGFILSYGIGEIPWIKQATFSIWEDKESMKKYAYSMHQHIEVIQKTRKENWYSEEMFVRFKIISVSGFPSAIETKIRTLQARNEKA